MKKGLIIAGVILLLVILCVLGYVLLSKKEAPVPTDPNNPFGSLGGSTVIPEDRIGLTLSNGEQITIPDITKQEQPAWAGPESGYQAGGSDEDAYHIVYFSEDTSFLISLLAEPLGANRLDAEDELRAKLGLTNDQLCQLPVEVATSIYVNESYAGQNLGLSFCPGAVVLP